MPVDLAELPPSLREMLAIATDVDALLARMLRLVIGAQASGEVESVTGLQLETWLSQHGRLTRADRSFLTTAAEVLAPMPATVAAFGEGLVSWSQVRAIVTTVRGLRVAQRAELDEQIAGVAQRHRSWEPDQLVWHLIQLVDQLQADTDPLEDLDEQPERGDVLVLQPRIDGTGGTLFGDYADPVAFSIIDRALSAQMGRPDGLEASTDSDARVRNRQRLGQARAQALTGLCADSLGGRNSDGQKVAAKPLVLATISLESLLGLTNRFGTLLTTLTGGTLKVDSATLRRLINDGGAQLRTIVLDDLGRAIGVGHKTYVPPQWLRETIIATQATCSAPGCRVSALVCDIDHIVAWPHGPTDVDNTTPACRHNHGEKTEGHWHVQVLPDGTRRWHHKRTGLTADRPLDTRPVFTTPTDTPAAPTSPPRRP